MTHTRMFFNATRFVLVAGAALVGSLAFAGQAEASKITFVFNCVITNATTCNGGGSFGTLTLTDSLVDANRVDVDIVLNGANIQAQHAGVNGLNDFFLNYGGLMPENTSFKLVRQSDPFGTYSNTAGDGLVSLDNKGPRGTRLDIDFDPSGSGALWTYSGSIVLRLDNSQHTETNLDVDMFNLKDANGLLYAGFDSKPTTDGFYGGSTAIMEEGITATPVPEPTSLLLLGSGLVVAARYARTRTTKA